MSSGETHCEYSIHLCFIQILYIYLEGNFIHNFKKKLPIEQFHGVKYSIRGVVLALKKFWIVEHFAFEGIKKSKLQ